MTNHAPVATFELVILTFRRGGQTIREEGFSRGCSGRIEGCQFMMGCIYDGMAGSRAFLNMEGVPSIYARLYHL